MIENVQKGLSRLKVETESEVEERYLNKTKLLEREIQLLSTLPSPTEDLSPASNNDRIPTPPPMMGSAPTGPQPELIESFRERIMELEYKFSSERKSKEQLSALVSSLQKEYIQYKTDVEMHLESNAAEQVLLQSRLIEQSVLLADARARIDELTSVQRRTPSPVKSGSSAAAIMSQREALIVNENNHLKEEIDSLKISMHADFDNWKRTVLKQVRGECIKYRQRLKKSMRIDEEEASPDNTPMYGDAGMPDPVQPDEDVLLNEKELDFLFDEVDWTGDMQQLDMTPEKLRSRIAKSP